MMTSNTVPDKVQKEVRAVLLSKIGGVPLTKFNSDFKNLIGHPFHWNSLGFNSLLDCIKAMPEVVRIDRSSGETKLYGVGDGSTFMSKPMIKAARGVVAPEQRKKFIDRYDGPEPDLSKFEQFMPNLNGFYAVCLKKQPNQTEQSVRALFSQVGPVETVTFSNLYVFVRYAEKLHACRAILNFKDLGATIPVERSARKDSPPQKKPSFMMNNLSETSPIKVDKFDEMPDLVADEATGDGPRQPCQQDLSPRQPREELKVFIGNVPKDMTEQDLLSLFSSHGVIELHVISNCARPFALAYCCDQVHMQALIRDFHDWPVKDDKLKVVKFVSKDKRKTQAAQSFGERRGSGDDQGMTKLREASSKSNKSKNKSGKKALSKQGQSSREDTMNRGHSATRQQESQDVRNLTEASTNAGTPGGKKDTKPRLAGNETKMELRLSNFPFGKTEEDLLDLLQPYNVFRVRIKSNSNKPTVAFADCQDKQSAECAITALNGTTQWERKLNVSFGSMHLKTPPPAATNKENNAAPVPALSESLPQQETSQSPTASGGASVQGASGVECPTQMKSMIVRMKTDMPPLPETFQVLVTSVVDKNHFWGHIIDLKETQKKLLELMNSIAEQGHRIPLSEGQNRCAALYEDEWCRAWIKEYLPGNMYRVFYPDYGNTAIVTSDEMCEIPNKYWVLPPQAIPFRSVVAKDDMPNFEYLSITVKMIKNALSAEKEPIEVQF